MRGLFFSVLALIAVLLIALGMMVFRPSWWNQATASLSRFGAAPTSTVSTDRAARLRNRSPDQIPSTIRTSESSHQTVGRKACRPRFPCPPSGRPMSFRETRRLPLRLLSRTFSAAFGPAQATVTGADLGQLHERMVYVNRSTGEETVILFLNGKVRTLPHVP